MVLYTGIGGISVIFFVLVLIIFFLFLVFFLSSIIIISLRSDIDMILDYLEIRPFVLPPPDNWLSARGGGSGWLVCNRHRRVLHIRLVIEDRPVKDIIKLEPFPEEQILQRSSQVGVIGPILEPEGPAVV